MVNVPPYVLLNDLDKTSGHIVLELDDGRRIEGHGMWPAGTLSSNGYVAPLRYEGDDVVEHF